MHYIMLKIMPIHYLYCYFNMKCLQASGPDPHTGERVKTFSSPFSVSIRHVCLYVCSEG